MLELFTHESSAHGLSFTYGREFSRSLSRWGYEVSLPYVFVIQLNFIDFDWDIFGPSSLVNLLCKKRFVNSRTLIVLRRFLRRLPTQLLLGKPVVMHHSFSKTSTFTAISALFFFGGSQLSQQKQNSHSTNRNIYSNNKS